MLAGMWNRDLQGIAAHQLKVGDILPLGLGVLQHPPSLVKLALAHVLRHVCVHVHRLTGEEGPDNPDGNHQKSHVTGGNSPLTAMAVTRPWATGGGGPSHS